MSLELLSAALQEKILCKHQGDLGMIRDVMSSSVQPGFSRPPAAHVPAWRPYLRYKGVADSGGWVPGQDFVRDSITLNPPENAVLMKALKDLRQLFRVLFVGNDSLFQLCVTRVQSISEIDAYPTRRMVSENLPHVLAILTTSW